MSNPADRISVESRPLQATHIDGLAVTAALAGLSPVPVKSCRVLEIRCAVGGNLLPMAQAFPDSSFVGIDTSSRQITLAQKTAVGAGLKNIRFEVRDFTALPDDFGTFDYVIAHGVFHWVNVAAREQLLGTIKRLLSPDGVAYVNYHVYPGWKSRDMFRDILDSKTSGIADPATAAAEAREFIAFLSRHVKAAGENIYAGQLRQESMFLATVPDDYLIHDYLQASGQALYFQQFADQLILNELTYVGEIKPAPARRKLVENLKIENPELAHDWARLEQFIDYIMGGFVRRSLICHSDKSVVREPYLRAIEQLSLRCMVVPAATHGDIRSSDPMPFRFADGTAVSISEPIVKTILVALARVWPNTFTLEQMLVVIRVDLQLGDSFAMPESNERLLVLNTIAACQALTLIDLHAAPTTFLPYAGERPLATGLARYQSRVAKTVTNVHHALVTSLSKVDRLVLAHLNGTRDRGALVGVMKAAISKGILPDPARDMTAAIEAGLSDSLEQTLEQSLSKLASHAFLLA